MKMLLHTMFTGAVMGFLGTRAHVANALFVCVLVLGVVSLLSPPPLPRKMKYSCLLISTISLPLISLIYTLVVSPEITIRLDLAILLPLNLVAWVAFLIKMIFYSAQDPRLKSRNHDETFK